MSDSPPPPPPHLGLARLSTLVALRRKKVSPHAHQLFWDLRDFRGWRRSEKKPQCCAPPFFIILDPPLYIMTIIVTILSPNPTVLFCLLQAIYTDFGFNLEWGITSSLTVVLNSTFSGVMCGLAGDYNGDPNDDTRTSTGTVVRNLLYQYSLLIHSPTESGS